jgi:hypothetical protein
MPSLLVPIELDIPTVIGLVVLAHIIMLAQANAGLVFPITNYKFINRNSLNKKIFGCSMLVIWLAACYGMFNISPLALIPTILAGAFYWPAKVFDLELLILLFYRALTNQPTDRV